MANTTIKITQLPSIGNALAVTTILPVVDTTGTATTNKVSVGNIANFTLTQAGNTLPPAFVSQIAYSVANAAQPNITSVGTLSVNTLKISGGTNGYVLQTDGTGNIAWVAGGGSGNGVVGGANTQIQFNNAGNFGGDTDLTWDAGNNKLITANFAATTANISSNVNTVNLNATGNVRPNAIYTDNYYYANGYVFGGGGGNGVPGGSNTEIQFNDNGVFGGNANLTFNKVSGVLSSPFLAGNGNGLSNIQGANISGFVPNANVANTAFAVAGANVSGAVSFAGTANSVAVANVVGLGNIATVALNGNGSQVLLGNGTWGNATSGASSELVNGNNSLILDSDGNIVLEGTPAGNAVNRGLVWDYGANANGVNSTIRQDNAGLTVRAWTEDSGNYAASVNIVTNQDANTKTWLFDGQGNLTLPGNLIVPEGNIESATTSLAFSSAITGITTGNATVIVTLADPVFGDPFQGEVTISSVTGTTEANGVWGYQATDPNEFQLYTDSTLATPVDGTTWTAYVSGGNAVGDATYTDFTIQGGNVSIGSNGNTWVFDIDGNLILAGGNSVIQSIANSSLDPVLPNVSTMVLTPDPGYITQSLVLDPTFPGHIHLRAPGANIDEPGANIFLGGEESSFEVGYHNGAAPNLFIHSGGNTWTFDNAGNLTFPRDAAGNTDPILTIGSGATPTIQSTNASLTGPANLAIQSDYLNMSGYTGAKVVVYADTGEILTDANMVLTTNLANTGNTSSWIFDTTGNLTVPNVSGGLIKTAANASIGIAAMDDGTNNPAQLLSMNVGTGAATSILSAYATNVAIQTNASGAINTWSFDNAGNLTLPANTFAINYANGTQVSLGGGSISNISNGNSNVNIATANGNVTIAAVGNTTMTITGTGANITGTANISGNVIAGNLMGPLANGNSTVTIATAAGNVVANVNGSTVFTAYSGGIKVGGSGVLQSPGGAGAITLNNNGANIPTANITNTLNVTGAGGANITANLTAGNISTAGNITGGNIIGNGNTLSNVATKTSGSWTLASGVNTVSISVPSNGTYSIWVNGNIPNGIVTYTATAVVTNTNVPVLGAQYAWYYETGNALVFTSIPDQFVGTQGAISNATPYLGNTANVFTFGITNNSGSSQVVDWGYTKL